VLLQPIIDGNVCTHIIDSENGECLVSSFISLPDIKDPQKLGSCITYFRRYTLKSLLAIAEGDDDGNLASKPTPIKKDKLDDKELEDSLLNGNIEELRGLLSKYECTELQKTAITVKGKELKAKS